MLIHCISQNSLHNLHYFELLSSINFAIYRLHNREMRYTTKDVFPEVISIHSFVKTVI